MMKRHECFTLLCVCLLGFSGHVDAQSKADCFKMQSTKGVKEIPVEKTFSESKGDNELKLFDGIESAYALSVSMDITRLSENFLVRVLLKDAEGRKHLVAESYKEIAPSEKTMLLTDYCEETALLSGIKPVSLLVITDNAEVKLSRVWVSTEESHEPAKGSETYEKRISDLRKQQVQEKVDLINEYNEANNKLWRAGATGLSLFDYEKKMSLIGCPEGVSSQGIEYYIGGIFQFSNNTTNFIIPYEEQNTHLDEFDWRNRHGRNWVTPVKNQGDHDLTCTAYASVAALESVMQLYYNQTFPSLDLSEGDIILHFPYSFLTIEGVDSTWRVVDYVVNNGVHDQASCNYENGTLYNSTGLPVMKVQPSGYGTCPLQDDSIHKYLREKGPMVSGYQYAIHWNQSEQNWEKNGHAMAMIGYGKVHQGMTLTYYESQSTMSTIEVSAGNPEIGHPYYIFKNSYGEDGTISPPYMYISFLGCESYMIGPYYYELPIQVTEYDQDFQDITKIYNTSDIVCDDRDGDCFYYWGVGPLTSSLPYFALNQPDGDDGDCYRGPIDLQDNILNLNPNETEWLYPENVFMNGEPGQLIHCYSHVLLEGFDSAEIVDSIYFHNGAKIYIEDGGELFIYGNCIYNAEIIMESGAKLYLRDGARVILREGVSFSPPVGAIIEIEEGSIEPYSPFSL